MGQGKPVRNISEPLTLVWIDRECDWKQGL